MQTPHIALIISLLGILVLILIMNSQSPLAINNIQKINSLSDNELITLSGIVQKQNNYDSYSTLKISNLTLFSSRLHENYIGKNVEILAQTEKYSNKTQLNLLKITILIK